MTPKQIERAKKKISDIKRILASERRKFGCYDDSRGLRYLPTKYFIQLGDYSGGLRYLNWFTKNFPEDSCFPDFLFEWTIILFKAGKTKEAAQKAFNTFCANPYWFDKFFGKHVVPFDIWHFSNLTRPEFTEALTYSYKQANLSDFAIWLESLISGQDFKERSSQYINIYKQLKTETDKENRRFLLKQSLLLEQRN